MGLEKHTRWGREKARWLREDGELEAFEGGGGGRVEEGERGRCGNVCGIPPLCSGEGGGETDGREGVESDGYKGQRGGQGIAGEWHGDGGGTRVRSDWRAVGRRTAAGGHARDMHPTL